MRSLDGKFKQGHKMMDQMRFKFARNLQRIRMFLALLVVAFTIQPALGAVIYSQDFNGFGFQGSTVVNSPDSNDKYTSAVLYTINNNAGWTFSGSAGYYISGSDGSVLLNECCIGNGSGADASKTISGLTPGVNYTLSFDVYGDNRPGGTWTLNLAINGGQALTLNGVDHQPGTFAGVTETVTFNTLSSSATLDFTQANSNGGGSPVFDNVLITAPVPEPSTWIMMILGFASIGFMAYRRTRPLGAHIMGI
jgi:PEP-CTERM motif